MRSFIKMTLAAILGCLIVGVVLIMFCFSLFGSLASSFSEEIPVMPREAMLLIDMSQITIGEQTSPGDISLTSLVTGGGSTEILGLRSVIGAIKKAATDPAVKFIYIKTDGVSGEIAGIEEMRKSLQFFRRSGKPVIAYTENPDNSSYYLATAADKIYMSSYKGGMNMLVGLSSSIMYFKDILDKLGINMQLIRHGKYKSAGETYVRNSISEENREQYQVLLRSIWTDMASEMASARDLSLEKFNSLIDNLELNSPEDFLKNGLVDELLDKTGREDKLCTFFGVENIKDVKSVTLSDYIKVRSSSAASKSKAKESIAIIYADGQIVDGTGKEDVSGDRFARIISDVRKDSTIKAVVFRVNSPGGSVTASEKIKNEIDRLREAKPVVASFGSYAASGGYWISNNCDYIFCDATTLTGSIGVFSMVPDFSGTAKKVGVNVASVSSNSHGDMYSGYRALDKDELAYMQESVEDIYDTFTGIVSTGRGIDKAKVDDMAQGRVWAGSDALSLGLVDEIGGIEAALARAVLMTSSSNRDVDSWKVVEYPAPMTMVEKVMEMFGQSSTSVFAGTPLECVERFFKGWDESRIGEVYAMMPYVIQIR